MRAGAAPDPANPAARWRPPFANRSPPTSDPPAAADDRAPDVAQAGAISAAILAALIGADPLQLRTRTIWVKALDYGAFSLWIVAVVLFVLLLALPRRRPGGSARMAFATGAAGAACVLTVAALVLLPFHFTQDVDTVALRLAAPDRAALDRLCGTAGKPLYGTIPTATLDDPFVTVHLSRRSSAECDEVRIPAGAILALREHPHVSR